MKSKDIYRYGDALITNVKTKSHKDIVGLVEFSYDVIVGKVIETTLYQYENRDGKMFWCDYYTFRDDCSYFHATLRSEIISEEPSTLYYVSRHLESICGTSQIKLVKVDDVAVYAESYVKDMSDRHAVKVKNRLKELNDKAEEEFKQRQEDQKAFHDKMDVLAKEVESESIWDFLRSLFKGNKK